MHSPALPPTRIHPAMEPTRHDAHLQPPQVTILSLALDPDSQAHFEALRQQHFPPALNRIAAHLTLFHALPADEAIREVLLKEAEALPSFTMQVSGVQKLGRGVAYSIESPNLKALHRRLANAFSAHLSPQDRQGFRPHVVVQNKAHPAEAKRLYAQLSASFYPWSVQAIGLEWWNYLGGPWKLREQFGFSQNFLNSPQL